MVLLSILDMVSNALGISSRLAVPFRKCHSFFLLAWMWLSNSLWGVELVFNVWKVMVIFLPVARVQCLCCMLMRLFKGRIFFQSLAVLVLGYSTRMISVLQLLWIALLPSARELFSLWDPVVVRQFWSSLGWSIYSNLWILRIVEH